MSSSTPGGSTSTKPSTPLVDKSPNPEFPKEINSEHAGLSRSEWGNILLLLLLYTLQGVPMGLSGSLPLLLQSRVSYAQLGTLSLCSLPFSLKVLWAPVVDAFYYPPWGQRKTWIVPVQTLCAFIVLFWGSSLDRELESPHPNVIWMTIMFAVIYALMATQDIAVDGWALTMLNEENRSMASLCNTLGQTMGFLAANVGFLSLNDPTMCQKIFRGAITSVSLGQFVRAWGVIMLASTLLLVVVKREVMPSSDAKEDVDAGRLRTLVESYRVIWNLFKKQNVRDLVVVLLLCRFPFGPTDAATHLKIVERGVSKQEVALLSSLVVPFGIISAIFVGRYASGPRPLDIFLDGFRLRWLAAVVWIGALPLIQFLAAKVGTARIFLLGGLYCLNSLYYLTTDMMFVSQMAFFARISDPKFGGTYMTMLNTVANMGQKWPSVFALRVLDRLAIKDCSKREDFNDSCNITLDGYYATAITSLVCGVSLYSLIRKKVRKIQTETANSWALEPQ